MRVKIFRLYDLTDRRVAELQNQINEYMSSMGDVFRLHHIRQTPFLKEGMIISIWYS